MEAITVTASERRILEAVRTLKPFERMEITADKDGTPGQYLVIRSTKVLLTDKRDMQYMK